MQRNLLLQTLFNLHFIFAAGSVVGSVLPFAFIRVFPHLLVKREWMLIGKAMNQSSLDIITTSQSGIFLVTLQIFVEFVLQSELSLDDHRDHGGVLGIQFLRFLGNHDRFRITLLLVEVVVLFHQFHQILINPDGILNVLFNLILDAFVLGSQFDIGGLLFNLGSQHGAGAIELLNQWSSGLTGEFGTFHFGNRLIDQFQSLFRFGFLQAFCLEDRIQHIRTDSLELDQLFLSCGIQRCWFGSRIRDIIRQLDPTTITAWCEIAKIVVHPLSTNRIETLTRIMGCFECLVGEVTFSFFQLGHPPVIEFSGGKS